MQASVSIAKRETPALDEKQAWSAGLSRCRNAREAAASQEAEQEKRRQTSLRFGQTRGNIR